MGEYYFDAITQEFEIDSADSQLDAMKPMLTKLMNAGAPIIAVVVDNANNVQAACGKLEKEFDVFSLGCIAHQIQLIVKKLCTFRKLKPLITAATDIIAFCASNRAFKRALQAKTNLVALKYTAVRWNSLYTAFKRLL